MNADYSNTRAILRRIEQGDLRPDDFLCEFVRAILEVS